jgi:cytochrome P450
VAHVLHGRSAIYEKGPLFTRPAGRRLLGRGVHTAGSEAHRALRREVQPLFGSRSVERYAPAILSAADGRLDRWGGAVDLKAEMFELTLDALGLALFGADWHPDLARAMRDRRRCIHYRVAFPVPLLADGLPLPVVRRFRRADARLREAVTVGVARRRAEGEASDLLGGLAGLTGSDGALLPVERIVDEALTLSVTGFETLADGLAWTLHLATAHPAIQERMASEVERALGGEPPGPSSARSLAFVSQVVMESYRLYPPTWLMVRRATQDDMLPSGTPVPRGSKLYVSPWVLGRRERYFPDPLRFDPDRFGEAPGTWPHAAHIPFGTGPRTCLGKPLAELEALIVIARVLQRYELTSASEAPPVPVPGVTLTPRGPVPVRVERRSRPSGRPAPLTSARAGAARAGR